MTDQTQRLLAESMSARGALNKRTLAIIAVPLGVVGWLIAAFPATSLSIATTVVAVIYVTFTVDRHWLIISGLRRPRLVQVSDDDARAIRDDELPCYTVLLPVYHEPSILQNLLDGAGQIEYPRDKLELLLLLEEDDDDTARALRDIALDSVRVVIVPHSLPKTKPKACNHAMALPGLRGEYVTIYDAEDVPDPLQLRRAVVAFQRADPDVGCIQAQLGFFNEHQNLLTGWFALEYHQWFGMVLPAVEAAHCIVPLGGTSNHMPTAVWHKVGGWDEYNVTEDADIGVRLARHGFRTVILDSITLEEANSDVVNWIRQRSRWYKGYLQTMIVHLRHPVTLVRQIGFKATLRFVSMTGGIPLTNALNLLFFLVMLAWFAGRPAAIDAIFPSAVYYVYLALFLIAGPLSVFINLIVALALGRPHLTAAALLSPLYWILQSVAAVKSIYQLLFRPFFWEKTVHGLTWTAQRGGTPQ